MKDWFNDNEDEKTVHNVDLRIKEVEKKYSGIAYHCRRNYEGNWEPIAHDYNSNDE